MEAAIEPDLEICDPHHHLWDRPQSRYMPGELLADTGAGHRVVSTVFVECMSGYRTEGPEALRPVGETEFVERVAREERGTRVAAAIVGFADLLLGDRVDAVLDAHVAASPRFRGIRHASGFDPSPDVRNSHTNPPEGLLGVARFREGFARLTARGLSFDAWLYHPQIPELTALARAFPEAPIVLDHLGGPLGIGPYEGKRAEVFAVWQSGIRELARCPNVAVKLGGLTMPICGFGWHRREPLPDSELLARAMAPYYLFCIEQFSPARCMFESNFPVDRVSCSYTVLWNAFKRIAAPFTAAERRSLFHGTAARFYRL
jgi:predicted TIM-barrel fold metal-dependent hydrolase